MTDWYVHNIFSLAIAYTSRQVGMERGISYTNALILLVLYLNDVPFKLCDTSMHFPQPDFVDFITEFREKEKVR
jgi:hypothetical protein